MNAPRPEAHRQPHACRQGEDPRELDVIELTGVHAWGHHGVLEQEKQIGQEFVVDVSLGLSTAPAGRADALTRTVNYAEVAALVQHEITTGAHDLIETLAERIAAGVLAAHPLLRRVQVTVHKPSAPVGVPFEDVRVRITRHAAAVGAVLAIGTNLGDREQHLARALEVLAQVPGVRIAWTGPVLETEPVGGPEQGAYLNSVIGVHTELGPFELLEAAHLAERDAGRERLERWGPRTLDVDVITYGDLVLEDPDLTLPHPRAHQRAFVLAPWHAARPDAELPGHGSIGELLPNAEDADGLRPGPAVKGFDQS